MSAPRFRLHLLGTGDNFATGGRANQAILGQAGDTRFLVDCGPTTHYRAQAQGIDLDQIDVVFVTHTHADHTFGIPSLLLTLQFIAWRKRPVTFVGPPGFGDYPMEILKLGFPEVFERGLDFEVRTVELAPGAAPLQFGALTVRAFEMRHSIVTNGYRLEHKGAAVAFTGDTIPCEGVIELADQADLLLMDCSYERTHPAIMHTSLEQVIELTPRITAKRIALTHTDGRFDPGPYEHPNDDDVLIIE